MYSRTAAVTAASTCPVISIDEKRFGALGVLSLFPFPLPSWFRLYLFTFAVCCCGDGDYYCNRCCCCGCGGIGALALVAAATSSLTLVAAIVFCDACFSELHTVYASSRQLTARTNDSSTFAVFRAADPTTLARQVTLALDWLARLGTLGANYDMRARLSISCPENTSNAVRYSTS